MIKTEYMDWMLESVVRHPEAPSDQRWSARYTYGPRLTALGWGHSPEAALADAQRDAQREVQARTRETET